MLYGNRAKKNAALICSCFSLGKHVKYHDPSEQIKIGKKK